MTIKRSLRGKRIGESHRNSKLTEEIVRHIRALHLSPPGGPGHGYKTIARLTGVPVENVRKIVKRRTWAWLEDANAESAAGT